MKVLKGSLDLVREAAEAAAEAGQSWAAEVALRLLGAVPCAHGLGWRLARLLRCCAPARTDMIALEHVRTDEQRCPLVRIAAGELISELRCAEQLEEIERVLEQRPIDFDTLTSLLQALTSLLGAARGDHDCVPGEQESLCQPSPSPSP